MGWFSNSSEKRSSDVEALVPSENGDRRDSHTPASGFGAQHISFLGGFCLLANNALGSAMVQIPALYQTAGWLPTTALFVGCCACTCISALWLIRTIGRFPGNSNLSARYEFGRVAQELFPRWLYILTVFILCFNFIATNISNIIVSAQTADDALLALAKKTCALTIYPQTPGQSPFGCIEADNDAIVTDSPFGNSYVISIGYLVVLALTLPLSYLNLDNNIIFQIAGVAALFMCVVVWVAQCCVIGFTPSNMPAVGSGTSSFTGLLPTILFNYGFVASTPSWLNEKSPGSSASRTLVAAITFASVLYILLGVFAGLALSFTGGADLLTVIADGNVPGMWTISSVCVFIFPVANLMTSIPVFSVMTRYNLVNTGLLPQWAANLVGAVLPWLLSLIFYAGNQLTELINWSSAALFVELNLLLPVMLYLRQSALTNDGFKTEAAPGKADTDPASRLLDVESHSGLTSVFSSAPLLPHTNTASLNAASYLLPDDDTEHEDVHGIPAWLRRCLPERTAAWGMLVISIVLAGVSVGLQAYAEYENDTGNGGN